MIPSKWTYHVMVLVGLTTALTHAGTLDPTRYRVINPADLFSQQFSSFVGFQKLFQPMLLRPKTHNSNSPSGNGQNFPSPHMRKEPNYHDPHHVTPSYPNFNIRKVPTYSQQPKDQFPSRRISNPSNVAGTTNTGYTPPKIKPVQTVPSFVVPPSNAWSQKRVQLQEQELLEKQQLRQHIGQIIESRKQQKEKVAAVNRDRSVVERKKKKKQESITTNTRRTKTPSTTTTSAPKKPKEQSVRRRNRQPIVKRPMKYKTKPRTQRPTRKTPVSSTEVRKKGKQSSKTKA